MNHRRACLMLSWADCWDSLVRERMKVERWFELSSGAIDWRVVWASWALKGQSFRYEVRPIRHFKSYSPKSFLKCRYFSCMMILSTAIRCSYPDSTLRLFSPSTTDQSAGSGRLNKSLQGNMVSDRSHLTAIITHLWMQCALESTQYLWISTPPHQCPMKPSDGCKSSSDACQPNSPSRVGKPNMIFGFLVVDVAVMLRCRFLAALANHVRREWDCEMTASLIKFPSSTFTNDSASLLSKFDFGN